MNNKIYVNLIRGWDQCYNTMEWKGFSSAKYTLPDYFQNNQNFGGDTNSDRWYNEVINHIGETFNYQWMPVGNPTNWTDKELEEMKDV
ncbi:MAG: hypothetical protein GY880_18585 [Planctomycetaceae bacterium]|nr:hypothetical protein [Planctomycetaceae bacterium]